MSKIRIVGVVGARPNFVKMAPVVHRLCLHPRFTFSLIHTGQHYDDMSDPFFRELGLPVPVAHLGVGSREAPEQIGVILVRLARVLRSIRPGIVLVAGDVNSTLAGALAARKLGLPVGHIEAGLRSFDERMPEELNRRLTDAISDFCFTHSPEADANLRREGVDPRRIHRVGNLMIDTLRRLEPRARRRRALRQLGLTPGGYALATLHRPSNVDRPDDLRRMVGVFAAISRWLPVVCPLHPRTAAGLRRRGVISGRDRFPVAARPPAPARGLMLIPPLGYLDFLHLEMQARFVLTDSGGVQEETTALGVPCLTLRDNTERPVTIRHGTNRLVGTRPAAILRQARRLVFGGRRRRRAPLLWDGRAATRLVGVLERAFPRRGGR